VEAAAEAAAVEEAVASPPLVLGVQRAQGGRHIRLRPLGEYFLGAEIRSLSAASGVHIQCIPDLTQHLPVLALNALTMASVTMTKIAYHVLRIAERSIRQHAVMVFVPLEKIV